MRAIIISALLIALAGAALAGPLTTMITIPKVTSVPTIDGKLSDGEWSRAAKIPYFLTVRGEAPDQPTTVHLCYTDRALLMAFECSEDMMPKLRAKVDKHDEVVWSDDSVELFIQPGSSLPYYHIAVNTLGTTYDAVNMKIMQSDKSWEPRLKVAASKGEAAWFVEIEIPIADLGLTSVDTGDSWRVNVCRERKTWAENTSWSPLRAGEATFADPERFGTMVFGDAATTLIDLDEFIGLPNGVVKRSGQVRNPSNRSVSVSIDTVMPDHGSRIRRPMALAAGKSERFIYTDHTTNEGYLTSVLECTSGGKVVYRVIRPFHVPPIRSRVADLAGKIDSTSPRTLRARLDAVSKEISGIHKSPPERVGEIERTLDELERGILAARLSSEDGQPFEFVAWAADPWAQLRPGDLPPQGALPTESRAIAYRGERVYAAANVTNLSARALDVRIVPGPFGGNAGEVPPSQIQLLACAFVPEEAGSPDLIGDALPLADGAGGVVVPAGETRQAFLVIKTDGLAPGEYAGKIRIIPTIVGPAKEITLRFTVYPLDLPSDPKPWICTWGGLLNIGWAKPNQRAYLEDALDHGVNVFLMNPASVAPKLDKDGNYQPIDFASLDRQFRDHAECTRAVGAYNISIQFSEWAAKAGIDHMSPAYRKAFIAWMRDWIAHLKSLGLSYDDFAFELVDEPAADEKLQLHIDTGKLMREADPQARIVTTTNFIEQDKLERIKDYVDIWVPQGKVLEDSAAREFMKRTGKEMWMYVCEGDSKRQCPVTYYRILPWQAFRYDLTGWGFFAHMWYGEQPWEATNSANKYLGTYSTVYPGVNGPVTSRRWECYFKGHEDFRALCLLKSLVARGEQAGLDVTDAKSVLSEALNGSAGLQEMKKNNRSVSDESAFLTDIRRKVADVSVKLSHALEGKK